MSALLPLTALLRRELLTQVRKKRAFAYLTLALFFFLWIVGAAWPSGEVIVWSQMRQISQGILSGLTFALIVAAGLFIPGVAATSLVIEREKQSWDLLSLTLIGPSGIALGKILSSVCLYLLYVIALFPFVAVVFFLTGIDWVQLSLSLILVLVTCVTCGAIGVACSAMSRKSSVAIVTAYAGMSAVMGLPALILTMLAAAFFVLFGIDPPNDFVFLPMVASPFPVLFTMLMPIGIGPASGTALFGYHMVFQAALTIIALVVTVRVLRRPQRPLVASGAPQVSFIPGRKPPPLPVDGSGKPRKLRRHKIARDPIPDGQNPIFAKELLWGIVGTRRIYLFGFLCMAGITLALIFAIVKGDLPVDDAAVTSLGLHGTIVCLFVAPVLAGLFTHELELGCRDALRMTLVTPQELVRGKYLAGLRLATGLSVASVVANIPLLFITLIANESVASLFMGHVTIYICALLAASLALFASAFTKSTGAAITTGVGMVLIVFFGFFAAIVLLGETWFFRQGFEIAFKTISIFSSPVLWYVYVGSSGFITEIEVVYLWLANSLEFALLALGIYIFVKYAYAHRRMRYR